ncbi:MAG: Ig-like domain-containing protein [archaeon]
MNRKLALLSIIIIITFFTVTVSAERYVTYTFKEAIITDTGITYTDTKLNYVNNIGLLCSDSQCNTVSGTLRSGAVTSSGSSYSMMLSYPTTLQSAYGYGEYFYTPDHITWEQNPNFWGTDPSDPQGPYTVYLSKRDRCISPIDSLTVINDAEPNKPLVIGFTASLDATTYGAISHAGPLNYVPPSLANQYYSVATNVVLRIYDHHDNLVFEEYKNILIPFSGSKRVEFTWTPTQPGNYKAVAITYVTDSKCMTSEQQTTSKYFHVLSDQPRNMCYTLLQKLATDDQFPSEDETLNIYAEKISNHADDNYELTPVPTKIDATIVKTSNGQVVLSKTIQLTANNNAVDYAPFGFNWDIPNPGEGWYLITLKGKADSYLCSGLINLEETITLDVYVSESVNEAPVIEGIPDVSVNEDTMPPNNWIDLWQYASDDKKQDNELTFLIVSQSNAGLISCTIDSNRYIDCGMPASNQYGHSDITIEVSDGFFTDRDTFRVNVLPENDAPQVSDIPNQTIDSCHQFQTFDLDNYVNDVDNSDSQISWTYSGNTYLIVSINSEHVVTVTYPTSFRGSETIRFTATDPQGAQDYDNATFMVTECQVPNTAPTIEGLPDRTVDEDTAYWDAIIDLWAYAQDNETADSGLTFTITSQTNNTMVDCIVDHNRYVDCATLPDMNGYSDVTVRVTDPEGMHDEDTFRITVQPVNDAPEVSDIPNQTIDSCHQFSQFDLDNYVNDVDNSDGEITWQVSGNVHLTVAINSEHVVSVGYPSGFTGSETIRFTATDPDGLEDYDDATFTVTECIQPPTNTAPELNIPTQGYQKNSGLHTIDLHDYAHDAESSDDQLTFTLVNQTNTGVVNCVIRNNRYLDCTVQQDMTGHSDITVRVTDPEGLYDEDTFRVSVTEVEPKKDPEVSPSIQITKVVYDDRVKQGGYLHVDIYVQGNKVKNTRATIIIPELGINEEFNTLKAIELKIPEKATTGKQVMEIMVKSNHNEQDNVYREFFIDPKNPEEGKSTATGNQGSTVTGSVTASEYNSRGEAMLTLVAIALTLILIVILVLIIGALTRKNTMIVTTEKFI